MKKIIIGILRFLARIKFWRTRPRIIGITGSYGKTTMKEVIACVLKSRWKTLKNEKSLNTDIGMCLAILEQSSGFSSPILWLAIIIKSAWNAFFSAPYDYWVLEYGIDKPGDMASLLKIARPDIAVITSIAPVHHAEGQLQNLDETAQEKGGLAYAVDTEGLVILNRKNEYIRRIGESVHARTQWYNSKVNFTEKVEQHKMGIQMVIVHNGEKIALYMPVVGEYHAECAHVALLIAEECKIPIIDLQAALITFNPPPGRMSLIEGINGAMIIDSSYNASPETVHQALAILKKYPAERRIAIIGSMNELGREYEAAHRAVATSCGSWLDVLVTVGAGGKIIADACLKQPDKPAIIVSFDKALDAAEYIIMKMYPHAGDVLLFKGSQNQVRLEKAVKKLMANPENASLLLCRQESAWNAKE